MQTTVVRPVFGQSYDAGWIGFTHGFGLVSDAIAYGERWQRTNAMPSVTHALIAIGDGQAVEAQMGEGVAIVSLSKYFDDPRQKIYFRKPLPWTPEIGARLVATARSKVGAKYCDLLIAEEAAADSLLGHLINKLLGNWPHVLLSRLLARPNEYICSYLAAYVLNAQPEFAGRDILRQPLAGISPQQLLEAKLFEDFINDCSYAFQKETAA